MPTQAVTGVSMTDSTHAWAVTQRIAGNNVVWRTVDGGVTWASQPTTANANLWAVSFVNNSLGFVSGDSGTILKTTDGGTTWVRKTTPTANALYAIKFSDANNGLAVGAGGVILRSTDGGETWVLQSSGTARTLWAVGALGTGFGFIGGDLGTLLRSGDIVPPTTTLTQTPAQPTGTNGWYKTTAPYITLNSSEAGNTYYSWTSASGPYTFYAPLTSFAAIEGSTTLYYYSVDLSSNVETPKSASFKVDLTPPTAPSTVATTVVASSTAQVSWTAASDALSGVAYYNVFVNASWVSSTTATTAYLSGLQQDSSYSIGIQTVDKAGNTAATNGTVSFFTN
jgi:hypothetical protein